MTKAYSIERYDGRYDWLSARTRRVHASDAAGVMGVAGDWASAMTVYADKTHPATFSTTTERQAIGLALEGVVLHLYVQKFGGKAQRWPNYTIAVSTEWPWLACTPDSILQDPDRAGLGAGQIKTASEFSRNQWLDSAPIAYQVQCQIEMAVLGFDWAAIPVLFGVTAVDRVLIPRNDTFIETAIEVLRDFWECVQLRRLPTIDGSAATARALARLHPFDNGKAIALDPPPLLSLDRLNRLKDLSSRAEAAISEIENAYKASIGDATFGVLPDGRCVSWKSQTRKAHSVAETTYRVLRECKPPAALSAILEERIPAALDYRTAKRCRVQPAIKRRILDADPRCCWCGCQLTSRTATIEHVVPLSVGGTNAESNLRLACRKCNLERSDDATLPVSLTKGLSNG